MFQTVVDESEVFRNAQLYDNNSYYAVDGCVFSYNVCEKNSVSVSHDLRSYLKYKAALGESHYGRKPIHIY